MYKFSLLLRGGLVLLRSTMLSSVIAQPAIATQTPGTPIIQVANSSIDAEVQGYYRENAPISIAEHNVLSFGYHVSPLQLKSAVEFGGAFSLFMVTEGYSSSAYILGDGASEGRGSKIGRWQDRQLFVRINDAVSFDVSLPWPARKGRAVFFLGRDEDGRVYVQVPGQKQASLLYSGAKVPGSFRFDTIGAGGGQGNRWEGSLGELRVSEGFLSGKARLEVLDQLAERWQSQSSTPLSGEFDEILGIDKQEYLVYLDANELEDVEDHFGVHPHLEGYAKRSSDRLWDVLNEQFYDSDLVYSKLGLSLLQIQDKRKFVETTLRLVDTIDYEAYAVVENGDGYLEIFSFKNLSELENEFKNPQAKVRLGEFLLLRRALNGMERKKLLAQLSEKWGL